MVRESGKAGVGLEWLAVVEKFGIPLGMCAFLSVLYVRLSLTSRQDRKECARDLRQLRYYTDRALENMRAMQNNERVTWMEAMNTLSHDLTIVLNDLLAEMKTSREQEKRTAEEVIQHIDKVLQQRGVINGDGSEMQLQRDQERA